MRILVLTTLFPNPHEPTRGVDNYEQFRALSRAHDVRVISPVAWTSELMHRVRRKPPIARRRSVSIGDMPVELPRYFFTPKLLRPQYGAFFRRSVLRTFERAVSAFKPDVVLGSWAYPDGWAAVKLAHAVGLPAVIKVHGCDVLNEGHGIEKFHGRYRGTVTALSEADAVVSVGRHLADGVVAVGANGRKVHVVRSGIDREKFSPGNRATARAELGIDGDHDMLLFVGRLAAVKDLGTLIDACTVLRQTNSTVRCYLVGDGPMRGALEQQVREHGLDSIVTFVGAQRHEQLPTWYRAADITVLPSVSEGVPNVLLESAACGTPFVATNVGGIPEIAVSPANLVGVGDAVALARAIAQQLRARETRVTTAPLARGLITWDESAKGLAEVLYAVVDSHRRSHAPSAASRIAAHAGA